MANDAHVAIITIGRERYEVPGGLTAEAIRCLAKHHRAVDRVMAEEGNIRIFYNRTDMTVSVTGLWRGYKRGGSGSELSPSEA